MSYSWEGRRSIYDFISKHVDEEGFLDDQGYVLPDDDIENEGVEIKFAPGAWDGVISHHMKLDHNEEKVKLIGDLIIDQLKKPSDENGNRYYSYLLKEKEILKYIDELIKYIIPTAKVNTETYAEEAIWLIFNSVHRTPLKFGIAMLDILAIPSMRDGLIILSKHDEFTIYAILALSCIDKEKYNNTLFEISKHVNGWVY